VTAAHEVFWLQELTTGQRNRVQLRCFIAAVSSLISRLCCGDSRMESVELARQFAGLFGAHPTILRAPGRVNLIGEHTDYNDGFVIQALLGFALVLPCRPGETANCLSDHSNFQGISYSTWMICRSGAPGLGAITCWAWRWFCRRRGIR